MTELIDRYATMDAIPAPTDADEAEYYGKVCDAIEAMPTIEADIDRAAILRLCTEIEMVIGTVCDTGYTLQDCDVENIVKRTTAIRKELAKDAGSQTD